MIQRTKFRSTTPWNSKYPYLKQSSRWLQLGIYGPVYCLPVHYFVSSITKWPLNTLIWQIETTPKKYWYKIKLYNSKDLYTMTNEIRMGFQSGWKASKPNISLKCTVAMVLHLLSYKVLIIIPLRKSKLFAMHTEWLNSEHLEWYRRWQNLLQNQNSVSILIITMWCKSDKGANERESWKIRKGNTT